MIKKGTKILCPNCNNPVAILKCNIFKYMAIRCEHFDFYPEYKPFKATTTTLCCSSYWLQYGKIYTEDGWIC